MKVPASAAQRSDRKGRKGRGAPDLMPELTCPGCGVTFEQRVSRQKWCSRRCSQRAWYAANLEREREWARARGRARLAALDMAMICPCGTTFEQQHGNQKYCSKRCGGGLAALDVAMICPQCGVTFEQRHGSQKYCSKRCGLAAWRATNPERVRERNRARRAVKRGLPSEPYTNLEIYERDKWICQLCRRKVNRRWKAPNRRAATIDHLIPSNHGGPDIRINVQLAHLGCNSAKCDRTLPEGEQLRLVG